jgi:hypothetical protein
MGFTSRRLVDCVAGASLSLLAVVAAPASVQSQAIVRGFLYDDSTGTRLKGAAVMLVDPATDAPVVVAQTDSLGQFQLKTGPGRYQIAAVRAGYTSVLSAPVALANGEQITVRVPIAAGGDPRNHIGVLEHTRTEGGDLRPPMRSADEDNRATRRKLGNGIFLDRGQLEKSNAINLGDLLRRLPGVSMDAAGTAQAVEMRRTSGTAVRNAVAPCRVGWFLDGRRVDRPGMTDPMTEGLTSIQLSELEAVEVYRGLSEMPAEFAEPDLRCGAVALWTRRGP